tara:strand:- start:1348 stop:1530 length:183 start_codon:yes stop_codon:yes gene_type:complete
MQKKVKERSEKITIETPYGTIESDSGNHYLDVATVLIVISFCAFLKYKGIALLKNIFNKK